MKKKKYSFPEFDYVILHFEHMMATVVDSNPEDSGQIIDDDDDGGD